MNRFSAEYLETRSQLVAILVQKGVLESRNGIAGFWVGDEWVSVYDVLEEHFAK